MSRPTPRRFRSSVAVRRRVRAGVVAVLAGAPLAASLGACGGTDPFAPVATLETALDSFQVYPLTRSPATLPAAISLYAAQSVRPIVRPSLSLNFDVAVDLDASGRVRLLPPKLVVAPQGGSLVTGMQIISNTTFDALSRAPNTGYQFDSATVVTPGQVVAVQTQGAGPLSAACATTTPMYAKIVVDSIRSSNGLPLIYLRARVDQNCGFRSLAPGLPSS